MRARSRTACATTPRRTSSIVGAETPLMKRFAGAFATEWLLGGGNAPNSFRFDPAPEALTVLKRDILKKAPDAALLAVDGGSAPLVKPFLGTVPAYASGLVFDQKSVATLRDLDGLDHRGNSVARDAGCAGIREVSAARFRQRGAGPPVRARARRVSHRAGAAGRPARTNSSSKARPGTSRWPKAGNSCARAAWPSTAPASSFRSMAGAERPGGSPVARGRRRARGRHRRRIPRWPAASPSWTRNFRTRRGEIDLIARDGATLVFVEVRLRRSQYFGGAGASITAAKCARLTAAARGYLATLGSEPPCRFDAVLLDGLDPPRIAWERDILSG